MMMMMRRLLRQERNIQRRQAPACLVFLLCLMLFVTVVRSEDQIPIRVGQPLFLDKHMPWIRQSAELALAIYQGEDAPPGPETTLVRAVKKGQEVSAVMMQEDDAVCYFVFRGEPQQGFGWTADIDIRTSFVKSMDDASRKCRVVKEYKTIFAQSRGYTSSYKSQVSDKVSSCVSAQKEVIFAGHHLGGAIATLYGVAYEAIQDKLVISFGAPPVFQPPDFRLGALIQSGGRLRRSPSRKKPCRYLTNVNYLPIINTETPNWVVQTFPGTQLRYDFMPYLHIIIYATIRDGPPGPLPDCWATGVIPTFTRYVQEEVRGNLGSSFGQQLLLAPSNGTDFLNLYHNVRAVSGDKTFRDFSTPMVKPEMLAMPPPIPDVMPPRSSCDDILETVGDMFYYREKLTSQLVESDGFDSVTTWERFNDEAPCNFDEECGSLVDPSWVCLPENVCDSVGFRPKRGGQIPRLPAKYRGKK